MGKPGKKEITLHFMAVIPSPAHRLALSELGHENLEIWVKRDDLIHPCISGNKWRKLKYNIKSAKQNGKKGLLTFGGAYSNHIAAVAGAAHENKLESVGIIRGDELNPNSNPTLRFANRQGMRLQFVPRQEYRHLKKDPDRLTDRYPGYEILPEGGTNGLAIKGCEEIVDEFDFWPDYMVSAYGTGGTLAGLVKGMKGKGLAVGVSSLKGDFVHKDFGQLLKANNINHRNYKILDNYHFGGYSKYDDRLIDFINHFHAMTNIPLDPIYTGKMMFAFMDLARRGFFKKNSKIVLLHTGGLQGVPGFNEKKGKKILGQGKRHNPYISSEL